MTYSIAFLALSLLFLWIVFKVVAVFYSPLSAVPNAHFTALFSRLWILWIRATGEEFSARLAAHRRLGPVIRLSPNELSINCIEGGVQTVYGGDWDKSSMYHMFTYLGHLPLFTISQAKPHAERKRIFAHVYSKSTIDRSDELHGIVDTIGRDRLQPRLRKAVRNGTTTDVFSLTREYSMDVVTAYIYGPDKGTTFLDNPAEASHYLSAFQAIVEPWPLFATSEIPRIAGLLERLGIHFVSPSIASSLQTIESFVFRLTADIISTLQTKVGDESGVSWFLRQVWPRLDAVPEEQKASLLASDLVDQAHAGHEATGIALTYLMWELSKRPETQDRLRDEFDSLRKAGQPPERSGLLEDVIKETLRLHPAGGGPFPRVAPKGAKLAGFHIPAGTVVSATPYTLGRNPDVFPEPESWRPERWSHATSEEKRRMKQWAWAFLSGSRVCIGQHLAVLTMKMFTVEVYSAFKTTIGADSNMRQLETFFAMPADRSLRLNFEAV